LSVLALEKDKEEKEIQNYLEQKNQSEESATIGDAIDENK
jgi:hypothetical protein